MPIHRGRMRSATFAAIVAVLLASGLAFGAHRNLRLLGFSQSNAAPERTLAVHERLNKVYTTTVGSLVVIDGETLREIAELPVPRQTWNVAVNESTDRVFVASSLVGTKRITVVDAATDVIVGGFDAPTNPRLLAVDRQRDLLLVVHATVPPDPDRLDIHDGTTWARLAAVELPGTPRALVTDDVAGRAYVVVQSGAAPIGTVVAVDTVASAVLAEIPAGGSTRKIALDPDRGRLYVTNVAEDTLTVIDTTTLAVQSTLPTGNSPSSVVVHRPSGRVYVTNRTGRTVTVIDGATLDTVATLPMQSTPRGLAVHPRERRAYVADGTWVRSIDTKHDRIFDSVEVDAGLEILVLNGAADRLWGRDGFRVVQVGDRSDPVPPRF